MEVRRVKCPVCNAVLDVRNSKNEAVKNFSCPQCKASLSITFRKEPIQPTAAVGGETRIVHAPTEKTYALVCGEQTYRLKPGRNIVGRMAQSSNASVQINSRDIYMSREHVNIRIENGFAYLSNCKNKNKTFVNQTLIQPGDEVRLQDNDIIKMGLTTVKMSIK